MTSHTGFTPHASEVCRAMGMVAQLLVYTDDHTLPAAVRAACLDSFFINVRLLVEFLVGKPDKRTIHRHDFLPGWEPEDSGDLRRLKREYGFVNEQIAHFSKRRILAPGDLVTNVAPRRLELIASLLLGQMQEFVRSLLAAGTPEAQAFDDCLKSITQQHPAP